MGTQLRSGKRGSLTGPTCSRWRFTIRRVAAQQDDTLRGDLAYKLPKEKHSCLPQVPRVIMSTSLSYTNAWKSLIISFRKHYFADPAVSSKDFVKYPNAKIMESC